MTLGTQGVLASPAGTDTSDSDELVAGPREARLLGPVKTVTEDWCSWGVDGTQGLNTFSVLGVCLALSLLTLPFSP